MGMKLICVGMRQDLRGNETRSTWEQDYICMGTRPDLLHGSCRRWLTPVAASPFLSTRLLAGVSVSNSMALIQIFTDSGIWWMACATTALAWSGGW